MSLSLNYVADQYCSNIDASISATQHCDSIATTFVESSYAGIVLFAYIGSFGIYLTFVLRFANIYRTDEPML